MLDNKLPSTSNGVGTPSKELNAYPLAKLLKGVEKAHDSGKYLLEESEKRSGYVSEDGERPRFFRTKDGVAYGFTEGGKVYIDPRVANVLHNMADKLKVGGKLVINVRGAKSIIKQGKEGETRITLDDPSEILVLRPNGEASRHIKKALPSKN